MSIEFNLVSDGWIPVIGDKGSREVSLEVALGEAHEIREFDGLGPPQIVSVVRPLLAILVDVFRWETLQQWGAVWERGSFDEEQLRSYLQKHRDRFHLLGGKTPFYQVGDLEPTSPAGIKPVSLVLPEVASGNNVPLFSSLIDDGLPPLRPAEAAIRLLTLHAYDTAAIKTGVAGDPQTKAGKTTGNPTGPLGNLGIAMALGRNLFETLMLNYPLVRVEDADRPAWRRKEGPGWERRPARGILDLLTWQSRRVRLFASAEGLVDRVIVAAGDRLDHTPLVEPHTIWRQDKTSPVAQRPARHQAGRSPWRGLTSLLTLAPSSETASTTNCLARIGDFEDAGFIDPDYPLDVLSVGVVYGNMSAVVEDVFSERIPLPVTALVAADGMETRSLIQGVVAAAEEVMNALNRLDGDLRRARGGEPVPWDGGQRPGEVFAAAMGAPIRTLLRAVQQGRETPDPATEWELTARRSALSIGMPLLENMPPETFLGVGEGKQLINQGKAAVFFLAAVNRALVRAVEYDSEMEAS